MDNSEIERQTMMEDKPSRCIHVYNKREVIEFSCIKDKKKGILVGLKQQQTLKVPKFDSNNLVLMDNNGKSISRYKNTGPFHTDSERK
ncbi:PREDICTED: 39S ribosomal protein L14, mitochondrial-like [Acromyrmex echinatior]